MTTVASTRIVLAVGIERWNMDVKDYRGFNYESEWVPQGIYT